jgi:hypothetical protein
LRRFDNENRREKMIHAFDLHVDRSLANHATGYIVSGITTGTPGGKTGHATGGLTGGLARWSAASKAPVAHTVSSTDELVDAGAELTRLVTGRYGVQVHARTSQVTDAVLRDLTSLIR